jgi:hypothetical protein
VLKVKRWHVTIAIILAVVLGFLLRGVLVKDNPIPESEILAPSKNTLPDQAEKTSVESSECTYGNDKVTLKLVPQKEDYLSTARPDAEFSYSLTKVKKVRTILPGVIYQSGEGVIVKLDNEQETIQIKRGRTYNTNQYQVFWKKKY